VVTFHCSDDWTTIFSDADLSLSSDSTLSPKGVMNVLSYDMQASPRNTIALMCMTLIIGAVIGGMGVVLFLHRSQSSSFDAVSQESTHEMTEIDSDGRKWSDVKVGSI
jgi:hypothetical protein